jgi:hypothetical protein
LLAILEHLHIREPLLIWGLFIVGLLLIADGLIRGEWAKEIVDPRHRRKKRIWYSVVGVVCFLLFGLWVHSRLKQDRVVTAKSDSTVASQSSGTALEEQPATPQLATAGQQQNLASPTSSRVRVAKSPRKKAEPPKSDEKSTRTAETNLQIPPGTTINATTNAPNSAAVGINTGTVNVNPPVNPNKMVVVYECNGAWHASGPAQDTFVQMSTCLPDKCTKIRALEEMVSLNNAANVEKTSTGATSKYAELKQLCEREIADAPEWLTPHLVCGMAYLGLDNPRRAKKELDYFDAHTGTAYNVDVCKRMADFLHSHLLFTQPEG